MAIPIETLKELVKQHGSMRAAAKVIGFAESTVRRRLKDDSYKSKELQVKDATVFIPADPEMPVEDLWKLREDQFDRKSNHEEQSKLIPVKINDSKPIGIVHFGDPHVDDDGTDLRQLRLDSETVAKTDGMYGANVGDTTNNWVGRLQRLYANQGTTQSQAFALAEYWVKSVPWLYVVAGNHDCWSGAGDPMRWICSHAGAMYKDWTVRIGLQFSNSRVVRINCSHDFPGSSIHNPAHAPMREQRTGLRDHIAICGHKHHSAYGMQKDPDSGIVMHGIRVASYKKYDHFAKTHGFHDGSFGPACVTIIDPRLPDKHPDLVKVFWDVQEGAEFLTWKRGK